LADGILLERAGVPAVVLCTDAFLAPAEAMARAYGFPGFSFVALPHPVAGLTAAQVRERVIGSTPDVLHILGVTS
jgi:hypothetical protein